VRAFNGRFFGKGGAGVSLPGVWGCPPFYPYYPKVTPSLPLWERGLGVRGLA
jgi:hypothetical protein